MQPEPQMMTAGIGDVVALFLAEICFVAVADVADGNS